MKTISIISLTTATIALILSMAGGKDSLITINTTRVIEKIGNSPRPIYCQINIGYDYPEKFVVQSVTPEDCQRAVNTNEVLYKQVTRLTK